MPRGSPSTHVVLIPVQRWKEGWLHGISGKAGWIISLLSLVIEEEALLASIFNSHVCLGVESTGFLKLFHSIHIEYAKHGPWLQNGAEYPCGREGCHGGSKVSRTLCSLRSASVHK